MSQKESHLQWNDRRWIWKWILPSLPSHCFVFKHFLFFWGSETKQNVVGLAAAAGAFEFFLKRKLTLPNQCTSCVCGIRWGEMQDLAGTALGCRISSCWWLGGGWGGGSNCTSELQFVVFIYPGICEVCVNHLVTVAGSDPIILFRTWDFPFLTIFQVRCIKILRHSFPGSIWKVLNTYMGLLWWLRR